MSDSTVSHQQGPTSHTEVASTCVSATLRGRPSGGIGACLPLLLLVTTAALPEVRAQNPSVELVPSIGYMRLFGGGGVQLQLEINRRIGAGPALAHWVGTFAQVSNTDLASATRPSIANRRTYVLGGAYSLRFRPEHRTSFGLAVPVAHTWSNNTPDVAIADPSGRPPEDRTGAEGTGIRVGLEGFLRHRLSPVIDLIAIGGIGHNPIYENQVSRSLSYLRLGVGIRP